MYQIIIINHNQYSPGRCEGLRPTCSFYILVYPYPHTQLAQLAQLCCPCPLHPFAMLGYAEAVRSALARFGNSLPFGHRRLLLPTSWQLLLRPHQTRHIIGPCSRNWHEQVEV